jgi:tetratricopeptide (TPR) repeat protein
MLQSLFFFRYMGSWYGPDPAALSIDVRPDFSHLSTLPWVAIGPIAFTTLVATLVFVSVSKKARPAFKLMAFGFFWAVSLFLIELSTVRFQEAVVLYRSYLWAPGFLLALAGLLSLISLRWVLGLAILAVALLVPLSWGRLEVFSSELALWREAEQKLPQATTPGAVRIHYNLGIFYAKAKQTDRALNEFEWVIAQDARAFQGYWGRSAIYMQDGQMEMAVDDLATVIRLKPDYGMAYFQLGAVLKHLGRREESELAFLQAEKLGVPRVVFK